MNTKLYKCIIAFILSFMALPMMAQDFMNIYFKDGNFRKFYMKNITEIVASKVDADGVEHEDYSYQQITTIYEKYVYKLEDVDSITFTKIDEEKAEENFVSAMPEVFAAIEDCETIEDVEEKIDQIKETEGVADAWSDGHQLYVSIDEGETFSFHLNHEAPFNDNSSDDIAQIRAIKARLDKIASSNGTPLKVVIANQQHLDEDRNFYITDYYYPLKKTFEDCGIKADYVPSPLVDFFYDNCHNQENEDHLNIYDYDIIFLVTHGNYGSIKYLKERKYLWDTIEDSKVMSHSINTSEELLKIPSKDKEAEDLKDDWVNYRKELKKWRDNSKYRDATDMHINIGFNHELKDGQWYWIGHPSLTELFFEDIAQGHFTNPNSILFNSACQSLKGDNGNVSYSFADKLFELGLGMYMGYSDTDSYGKICGPELLTNMLKNGWSLEKSKEELPLWMKEENLENILNEGYVLTEEEKEECLKNLHNAQLLFHYNPNNDKMSSNLFLLPPHTEQISIEKANEEYFQTQELTINGDATLIDFENSGLKVGFTLTYHDPVENTVYVNAEVKPVCYKNKVEFSAELKNLERGRTYSYRAYTYDGLYRNYGNECTFTIYKDLQMESTSLTLEVGGSESVTISSGNGGYTVEIDEDGKGVVTATVEGETVKITAIGAGPATVTVTDNKTGQTATINVTVTAKGEELTLSATNLVTLKVDEGRTIVITSGSGDYSVECSRDVVANVKLRGKYISITGVREGRATITVTDDESGQRKSFDVKVKSRSSSSVVSLVNNGNMEGSDVSCFFAKTGAWDNDYFPAEIIDGVGVDGSHGIEVDATDMVSEIWDNQFWIRFDQPVSAGTNYRIYFDYRADNDATVRVEEHGEPGDYIEWERAYIDFTPDWNTYSKYDVVASNQSLDEKPFQSLAFDLSMYEYANNYYFDNVKFEVYLEDQCPKPTFTVAENVVSIESPFNATIYYTLDGTTPTTSSSVYSSSIILESAKSWTIKAIAVVDGYEASPVATYYYTGGSQ